MVEATTPPLGKTVCDSGMIGSRHFVFVHMPKTGGTFVQSCLEQLNQSSSDKPARWFSFRRAEQKPFHIIRSVPKHGTVMAIPAAYEELPIVGCIRDPLEWYRSNYRFAWWQRYPDKYPGVRESSEWPNISFKIYFNL